jgi:ubiquinone/menaquinone biosynthesis C-methylase UbiE
VSGQISFDDGAAYERYMGQWSQLVGNAFLGWLAPPPGLRWLDVGCGNGAFTELIVARCAPASVTGIDPSEAQIAFARTRPATRAAQFRLGGAMALPFPDAAFDAAVMPLVIVFVPDPATGVSEMVRVVRAGGLVAAYMWAPENGSPYAALQEAIRALGSPVPVPPNPEASRMDALRDLWRAAGLEAVETRAITVQRTFADFEDYWAAILGGPSVGPALAAMAPAPLTLLKAQIRAHRPADAAGRISYSAVANAVTGRVPGARAGRSARPGEAGAGR